MTSISKSPEPRIVELDAVRGIAAVMVLVCHLPRGFWFGETGVDLFFALSGFLISGIILRNREKDGFLKVFYTRRALRIFPIYYLTFIGILAVNALRRHPATLDGLGSFLTYTQFIPRYWGSDTPRLDLNVGHTWTLAIEEQFYLLWPLALVMFPTRFVPWLCIGLTATSSFLRSRGLDCAILFGHIDGLVLGSLLAWVEITYGARFRKLLNRIYLFLTLAGFVIFYMIWATSSASGFTGKQIIRLNSGIFVLSIAYTGIIGIVQAMSGKRWLAILRWQPLAQLGTISYGLYLYHWIIYGYLDTAIKFGLKFGDTWWLDVLKIMLSLAAAVASWVWIEKPILQLKDRVSYAGSQSESQVQPVVESAVI
jgi:peptidoglycan/LPS O-acetylase OafA/YrhL